MYENLIKALRLCVKYNKATDALMNASQAADAIEELNHRIESLESEREISPEAEYAIDKHADNLISHMDELIKGLNSKPRWVSVKERLPDAYDDVLLQFPNNQAVGFCDRDGCWGVYSGDGFYTEVADNEPKPTHWAKKLPEPTKELI